jgi:hypothetical protein
MFLRGVEAQIVKSPHKHHGVRRCMTLARLHPRDTLPSSLKCVKERAVSFGAPWVMPLWLDPSRGGDVWLRALSDDLLRRSFVAPKRRGYATAVPVLVEGVLVDQTPSPPAPQMLIAAPPPRAVLDAMESNDTESVCRALKALAREGREALEPYLARALADRRTRVRGLATRLTRTATHVPSTLPSSASMTRAPRCAYQRFVRSHMRAMLTYSLRW